MWDVTLLTYLWPNYGALRPVVSRPLEGFQRCGILAWGFAHVRCPDCRHEYLLAFSCKQRCLCPACHAKRQAAFGEFVTEEILEAAPHRQFVISLSRRLRPFYRRRNIRSLRRPRSPAEAGFPTSYPIIPP